MISINNGARVVVSLSDYDGVAGFVAGGPGDATISYRPRKTTRVAVGSLAIVDDKEWTVLSVGPSDFVRGFQVVSLKKATPAATVE